MEIPRNELTILYHCGYWDGPLSGVALYQGRKVWFQAIAAEESDDRDEPRGFGLYSLTDEQIQVQDADHALFQQYVGTHTDYVDGKRRLGNLRPAEEQDRYYSASHAPRPLHSSETLIGTFSEPLGLSIV